MQCSGVERCRTRQGRAERTTEDLDRIVYEVLYVNTQINEVLCNKMINMTAVNTSIIFTISRYPSYLNVGEQSAVGVFRVGVSKGNYSVALQ